MIPLGVLASAGLRSTAPPIDAGLPPTTYAGLTFWYDGENSPHYQTSRSNSAPSEVNDSPIARMDSVAGINRIWASGGTGDVSSRLNVVGQPKGLKYRHNEPANSVLWTKPSAGSLPTAPLAASALVTSAFACAIALVRVNYASPLPANPYDATSIFGDYDRYLALQVYGSGGAAKVHALNYPGVYHYATDPGSFAFGAWTVLTLLHRNGQLIVRRNGTQVVSVASGNTAGFAQATGVLGWVGGQEDIDLAHLCTYNQLRTDAEILEVEKFFGGKAGLILG